MSLAIALALAIVCAGPETASKDASDKQLLKAANSRRIVEIEQEIRELDASLKATKDLSKHEKKVQVDKITSLKIELKQRKTNGNVKPPPITTPYRQGQVGSLDAGIARVMQILGPEEMLVELIFSRPTGGVSLPPGYKPGDQVVNLLPDMERSSSIVMLRGLPTGSLADNMRFDLPGILEVGGNHTYETAGGGSKTVRVFSPFTLGEYPKIAGVWRESPTVAVTIKQKGHEFTALCAYHHEEQGEIRWQMTGTVSKDRQLEGHLVHTQAPKTWASQVRTGLVSSDGTTIKGHAAFDGGGGAADFEWKLETPSPR